MGDASATPSSRGGSNYRKVLFSPDDMASFENLLDQVEDVDAGRARWKPPRDVAEEDAGEDVYARGGIRAWCTGLNVAVLVVALATAFVGFDLARSYVLARSSAAVVIDETLERAADPRAASPPLAATRGPAAPAATALAAAAGEGVVARPEPSSSPVGGGGGGLVDLAKAHLVAASATAKRGIAGILDAFDEPGGTTRDEQGGDAVAEASGNDDEATGPAPPSPPRRFAKGPKTKTAGASQDDSRAGASRDDSLLAGASRDDSLAGASRDDSLADSNAALESEEARRERHAREDEARRERHEREDRERAARHAMEDELRERQRAKETAERAEEAGAEENANEANEEAEEAKEAEEAEEAEEAAAADVEVAASTGDGERGARPSGTVGGGDYDDATR
jgi:hypothetical protein